MPRDLRVCFSVAVSFLIIGIKLKAITSISTMSFVFTLKIRKGDSSWLNPLASWVGLITHENINAPLVTIKIFHATIRLATTESKIRLNKNTIATNQMLLIRFLTNLLNPILNTIINTALNAVNPTRTQRLSVKNTINEYATNPNIAANITSS